MFKEREQSLELQRENDGLRIQEVEDRKKIRDLLAMTQPVQQEVTYFKDSRPEAITKLALKSQYMTNVGRTLPGKRSMSKDSGTRKRKIELQLPSTAGRRGSSRVMHPKIQVDSTAVVIEDVAENKPLNNAEHRTHDERQMNPGYIHPSKRVQKSNTLRTLFLPHEKVDSLLLTVESLQATLEEQKRISREREEQMLKERDVMIAEERARLESDRLSIKKLQQELNEREAFLAKMTNEYVVQRHNHNIAERALVEEVERLRAENQTLELKVQEVAQHYKQEAKMIALAAREKSDQFASHFRQQAIERENQVIQLQKENASIHADYEVRFKNLENRAQKLRDERDEMTRRRKLEREGYQNDIVLMKKDIRTLEAKLYKSIAFHLPPHEGSEIAEFLHYNAEIEDEIRMINERLMTVEREMKRTRINGIKA